MKTQQTTLAMALAAAIGSLASMSAHATLVTTTDVVAFNGSNSATGNEGGGATTISNASLGTSNLQQFDASLGVLMGTTLNLESTRTQTTTVTGVGNTESKGKGAAEGTAEGAGSSSARIVASGVDYTFLPVISLTESCSGAKNAGCSASTSSSATTTAALAAGAAGLDAYVGNGTLLVTRTAPTLTAEHTSDNFPGDGTTNYNIAWAGELSATYDYLSHAAPSFDAGSTLLSLDLDFGYVTVGELASLSFSLFNLAGDRVGLDLDGFDAFTGPFSTDLSTFAALGAGDFGSYEVVLDTSAEGNFDHAYTLFLSDANVGAAASRWSYQMTLHLTGTVGVLQEPSPVPEPGLLALLGIGLTGLAASARRRRTA